MKKQIAELIEMAARESDAEIDVRDDYSGRGMYGKTTHAVCFDSTAQMARLIFRAGQLAAEYGIDEEVGSLRMDQMGMGIVVY